MCRLFGLHAGGVADAEFWLLDAPDSLTAQSHQNPDGAGIGCFGPDGRPQVDKQPIAAWQDTEFARAARRLRGSTFVAHVRYASTGAHTVADTHPFLQDGRLFAHNGVVQGLDQLDRRLAELGTAGLVAGQTDSERVFALITAETRRNGGDVGAALVSAVGWIADRLPVYAVNLVLATATDLWALRYPDTHELQVLDRPAGGSGPGAGDALTARSDRINARSKQLARQPSVIIATERMDDDPGWRLLDPGELLHVGLKGPDLAIGRSTPFPAPPRQLLRLADLDPAAAASQHPA
ncbi:MAG TPA: class II glutamine amidotransferase [Streptosporangiaceae bacterium]|jgi:glutamine amidotransferase|nr:class II glutamine amidotransferase [Streptosporangiaceae bacterium]